MCPLSIDTQNYGISITEPLGRCREGKEPENVILNYTRPPKLPAWPVPFSGLSSTFPEHLAPIHTSPLKTMLFGSP